MAKHLAAPACPCWGLETFLPAHGCVQALEWFQNVLFGPFEPGSDRPP